MEKKKNLLYILLNKKNKDLIHSCIKRVILISLTSRVSGVGLNDSPAGLAAYLIEKFSTGTNYSYKSREDGGFLEKYTYDELIDNLMIYWASNSITTAMRIYAEMFIKENFLLGKLINSCV